MGGAGSDEQRILEKRRTDLRVELARSICHAYVHFARIIDFGTKAQSRAGDDWHRISENQRYSALSRAEEDAVLIALNRINRFIRQANKIAGLPPTLGEKIVNMKDAVYIVRNIREHLDEYLVGEGRQRQDAVYLFPTGDGQAIPVPANWSFQHRDKQTIGGRVDLRDVGEALRQIYDEMKAEGLWELPWTPHDLIAAMTK